jgi:LuxR family maltose regulon positive regulatory protein
VGIIIAVSVSILATKLHLPPVRPNLVARPRLTTRLAEGLTRPLTLISARAGFGKTTLISEWRNAAPTDLHLAWLALDEEDNDPVRFLTYLIAALQTAEASIGENGLVLLQAPQPPRPTVILTTLINELVALRSPLALVLDDYHAITASAIHEALTLLVDRRPPTLRLILTTRADPPLPLARWRVRDQLTEIRADDLRMTTTEAAQFLERVMGLTLSDNDIAALEARTEGWVAGLQLAALSMRGRDDVAGFIRAFANSPVVVVDYLAEEVLGREPAEVQTFLLQTCVLERLGGALCDALTGRADGQQTLEYLRQRNLLIIALDDERQWYRYHHLFADVLRAQLRQTLASEEAELHRRASAWLEQKGLAEEAVSHALAGQDYERSARLIEANRIRLATTGQVATLSHWLNALPAQLRRTRPGLALAQAWVAGPLGDYAGMFTHLADAEAALAAWPEAEARPLRGEIAAARVMVSSFLEDPHALAQAQQALADLPAEAAPLRFIAAVGLGFAYFRAGQLAATEGVLHQLEAALDPQAASNVIGVTAMLAMVYRQHGRLRDAQRFGQRAVDLANIGGRPLLNAGTILAYAILSRVAYERGQLKAAEAHLRQSAELAREANNLGTHLYALTELTRLALTRHDLSQAQHWMARAEALTAGKPLTPTNQMTLEAMRAQVWMAEGKPAEAERWARAQQQAAGESAPRLTPYDLQRLVMPEAQMAQRHWPAALDTLSSLSADAEATGHTDYLVKALTLQAVALQQIGKTAEALSTLRRVLALAEPEGYITIFVERGETMRGLLTQITGNHRLYAQRLLGLFDSSGEGAGEAAPLPHPAPAPLLEALSDRELEILRLVAQGLPDREVAEKLVVVIGTVKKHLSNIYGKLGVRSRTQAVARAHELGLL